MPRGVARHTQRSAGRHLALTAALIAAQILPTAMAVQAVPAAQTDGSEHVGICHATGTASEPYLYLAVPHAAADLDGHADHPEDIVGVRSAADCPQPTDPVSAT